MLRLLLVDDDVIVRKWLRLVFQPFEEEFLVVDAVSNGKEALEVCHAQPVDLVITDLIMPDMDGIAFIQALREFDAHTQVVILSNYADFSFAQKGMSFGAAEYLLKGEITEAALLEVVRRVGQKITAHSQPAEVTLLGLKSSQLPQLLNGTDAASARTFDAALQAAGGGVWVIVFSLDLSPVHASRHGFCAVEWTRQLYTLLKSADLPGAVCPISDQCTAALLPIQDADTQAVVRKIRHLPTSSQACSFSLSADGPAHSARQTAQAYLNARSAIEYRFFQGPGSIHFYRPPQPAACQIDFREERHTIQTLAQAGEFHRLIGNMERICSQRECYGLEDIDRIRRLFNTAGESLIHHTLTCCPESLQSNLAGVNPLADISGILFLDDLMAWLRRLAEKCRILLQGSANDANMRRVFDYIEQNYMHELSLNMISDVAGFSPNYFCNIFKEYTGKNIRAYITDLRIQHAKQLLNATNKSIHMIAEEVGYESDSYFIKVFKELTGFTPKHFRRMNR